MKPAFAALLVAAAAPAARGQIFADVSTSMGGFTIQLRHAESPRTVANFIRLAEGSAPWVNPRTGRVHSNDPFYDGIVFHRVIAGFMSQTGSPKGDGTDGPGYSFPDEVANGLGHPGAHVVSMANSGPNTNGSQFFITAGAASWLDGKHTVFGNVVAGQAVCDAINGVATDAANRPLAPVTIQSVAIRREGAAALAFDEHAPMLPAVTAPAVVLSHTPAATALHFPQPARSIASCHLSDDMQAWVGPVERFLDAAAAPAAALDLTENVGDAPAAFIAASVVGYPADAVFPASMGGRTLVSTAPGAGLVFTFVFDGAGGGMWSLVSPVLGGAILDYINEPDPYGSDLIMLLDGISLPFVKLRLGIDGFSATHLTGRQAGSIAETQENLGQPGLSIDLAGTFVLTR